LLRTCDPRATARFLVDDSGAQQTKYVIVQRGHATKVVWFPLLNFNGSEPPAVSGRFAPRPSRRTVKIARGA